MPVIKFMYLLCQLGRRWQMSFLNPLGASTHSIERRYTKLFLAWLTNKLDITRRVAAYNQSLRGIQSGSSSFASAFISFGESFWRRCDACTSTDVVIEFRGGFTAVISFFLVMVGIVSFRWSYSFYAFYFFYVMIQKLIMPLLPSGCFIFSITHEHVDAVILGVIRKVAWIGAEMGWP